jgi:uncharacterized protein YcfJ
MHALQQKTTSILILFALVSASALYGKDIQVKLRWQDLPKNLEGQRIRVIQTGQKSISGVLVSIEPNQLVLETRAGKSKIARPDVATIETRKKLVQTRHRIIGTAIGAGVGVLLLATVAAYAHNEGGVNSDALVGAAGAIAAGTTALGYWAGQESDSQRTIIQLVQETH